jgi:uncharacterized protein
MPQVIALRTSPTTFATSDLICSLFKISAIAMLKKFSLTLLLFEILFWGYTTQPLFAETSKTLKSSFVAQATTQENRGQQLPIEAKAVMGNETIELEVTRTPEQQQMGLMYRSSLPKNRGMLFSFNPPTPTRFWMKNTIIPLDLVFLRNGRIIAIFPNVPPCKADPCESYGPASEIDQVIELVGGRAKELGLKVGDKIAIEFISAR